MRSEAHGRCHDGCDLVGAAVGSAVRHQGFGISLPNADRVLDRADAGKVFFQRLVMLRAGGVNLLPAGMSASGFLLSLSLRRCPTAIPAAYG